MEGVLLWEEGEMKEKVPRMVPEPPSSAQRLRRDQADAEQKLWIRLRDRQVNGLKFRRQYTIGPYVVAFCCGEKKLIIDIYSGQNVAPIEEDQRRANYLSKRGYQVLRFRMQDVLKFPDVVLEEILAFVERTQFFPGLGSDLHSRPLPGRERELKLKDLEQQETARETPLERAAWMPAEWKPHEATWIGWPHNASDWPGKLAVIHWVYAEMVRKIASRELVRILVNSSDHEKRAARFLSRVGVELSCVEFFRIPTNRGWTRDFGPIFVIQRGARHKVSIARFRFNAWARYPDWKKDDEVSGRVATLLESSLLPVQHGKQHVVLEGGSVDLNGMGALLTTEECLLHPTVQVRNPGFTREDYESVFQHSLGATKVIWLGQGIAGDDTHGHVDDVCRFVGPSTVVLCQEKNAEDTNYRPLSENRERLEGMTLPDGAKIEVVPLPMPAPLFFDGRRLPASYANFYISNAAVLVPTFNDPNDRIALGILGELFRDRPVVGIHAVDLVWGFGSIHCLTQQQPTVSPD